jgi:hypothetical protein
MDMGKVEIACTLDAGEQAARGAEWRAVVGTGQRDAIPGGVRLRFGADPAITHRLVDLVAGERSCCGWASWMLTSTDDATVVEVTAADDGADVLQALFEVTT